MMRGPLKIPTVSRLRAPAPGEVRDAEAGREALPAERAGLEDEVLYKCIILYDSVVCMLQCSI